jgi:hypothetical protein
VPPATSFSSCARNHEDVVLGRALAHRDAVRYVEVGAPGTGAPDVLRALRSRGWSQVTVEDVLERRDGADDDLHVLLLDACGSEGAVLAGLDLDGLHPWVLVVAATAPGTATPTHGQWEPAVLAAGYRLCLFDGISRFYVAEEHADLQPGLSYPACALDAFEEHLDQETVPSRAELLDQVRRWRTEALTAWGAAGEAPMVEAAELDNAERELAAMRATLSWRITRPVRAIRRLAGRT